ncbi:hypothetical protein ZWY2020_027894 [Hordeum vulgare]|nr:hypothetical protein ZWY2020_027894 [Hordeum vulgare]
MRRVDGDMMEARLLLRSALCCVKDYASVYRTWIAMEKEGGGGGVGVARWLCEQWGAVCAKDGSLRSEDGATADEYGDYWCAYLAFELGHGNARRARAVAAQAVRPARATPRCATRWAPPQGRAGAAEAAAAPGAVPQRQKWLADDLRACISSVGEQQSRGCRPHFVRPPRGFHRLVTDESP